MDYVARAREASRRWREVQGLPPRPPDLLSVPSLLSSLPRQEGIRSEEEERPARECITTETTETTKEREERGRESQVSMPWRPTYAHPWPDELRGLGPRRIGPYASCSGCGCGSWVRYGGRILCCPCAVARAVGGRADDEPGR
jgi:hypothetical protein